MNFVESLAHITGMTATFDPRMAVFLFLICTVGEFGIPVPYVLESVWLLSGYQLGIHILTPTHFMGLWLAAQVGRQTGSIALYSIARLGKVPLGRLYNKMHLSRFFPKSVLSPRLLSNIDFSSPFSLAFGRLVGLRIPYTIGLAAKGKLKVLPLGVLLSSVVWDAVYISLGITAGAVTDIKPAEMFLISIVGLTLLYLITFLIRYLTKGRSPVEILPVFIKAAREKVYGPRSQK